jgi:hypothetical protein
MAITYATNFVQANTQNVASGSLTVATNDVILVLYSNEDNSSAGTLSIAKSAGTSTVSAFTNIATTNTNSECKAAVWFCTVTAGGTFTVTVSKTGAFSNHSQLATIVHTGADTSNPCPSGNRFSGIDTNGDTTQSITPTASGSALWMIVSDWNATNTFSGASNCTLANTYHSAGVFTSTVIQPTTQPRTDSNAFTIGEADTGATNAWVACEVKAASSGDQALTPSVFTNTNTFYTPTVGRGEVNLIPALYSDADTFYIQTVSSNYSLIPSLYSDADTFYTGTIGRGSVGLTPSLYSDSDSFYTHIISAGATPQTLTASLFANSNTYYTQTVSSSYTLTPSLYSDSDTYYTHTVLSSYALTPSLYTDSDSFYTGTVGRGTVNLTANLYIDADVFYSATVSGTGTPQTLTAALYSNAQTYFAHTVTPGAIGLTASILSDSDTFYTQAISSSYTLTPNIYVDTDTFYTGTIGRGAVNLTPNLYSDVDTFYNGIVGIEGGPQSLIAALYANTNTIYNGTVTPGLIGLTASLYSDADSFYTQTVGKYNVLLPALYNNPDTFYSGTITTGAVNLTASLYNNSSIFYIQRITAGELLGYIDNPSVVFMQTLKKSTFSTTNRTIKLSGN